MFAVVSVIALPILDVFQLLVLALPMHCGIETGSTKHSDPKWPVNSKMNILSMLKN